MTRLVSTSGRVGHGERSEPEREDGSPDDALRRIQARLDALLSSLDDLVFELDAEGRYLAVWSFDDTLLAESRNKLLGRTVLEALGEDVGGPLMACIGRVLASGAPEMFEYSLQVPAGRRFFQARVASIRHDGPMGTVCVLARDVTAQRQAELSQSAAEDQLRHQGLFDALTGLPNRVSFRRRLEEELSSLLRPGPEMAVLLLNLDRFKEINDTLGRAAGNEVLREVGARLAAVTRTDDFIARLGSDEFAVMLPGASASDATQAAMRLAKSLEESIVVDGISLNIDMTVGFTVSTSQGTDADLLLRQADIAMSSAKRANLGVARYEASTDPSSSDRLTLIGELRGALERNELVLHYQPQLLLSTGDVVAVEALIRWQHPRRGLMPPGEFVPAVEETGLIKPLTNYVLDSALRQCRQWMEQGRRIRVGVNLAMRNLIDVDLAVDVADLLRKYRVPTELLELEVTESSLIADPRRTEAVLSTLAGMGIRLSIDDFGTGFSSLTYLTRLPVDEIKIDRSFVTDMDSSAENDVIVRSTIELGRSLGKEIVAEGVETAEVLRRLASLGCDLAQGYHVSRPLPVEALEGWLQGHSPLHAAHLRRRPEVGAPAEADETAVG